MNILYIDDDHDDGIVFSDAVKEVDRSITCRLCFDARDVISEITASCPDYIFLDFRMPLLDGTDVLSRIRD